jgi:hypothetical protein
MLVRGFLAENYSEALGTLYIGWYIRNAQRFREVPRLTPAQNELLDLMDSIANDPAFHLDMDFEPGDIQFLKNAVILHARTEYEIGRNRRGKGTCYVSGLRISVQGRRRAGPRRHSFAASGFKVIGEGS